MNVVKNYNYAFLFYDVNEKESKKYLKYAKNIYRIFNIQFLGVKLHHLI